MRTPHFSLRHRSERDPATSTATGCGHKLRVVLLTTSFPLRQDDVSGVFVRRLATALGRLVDVTVVTPAGKDEPEESPFRLCPVRYAPRKWQRLAHFGGGIPDAIRRRDPKLIFLVSLIPALFIRTWREARRADLVHGNWSVPSVIGAIAAKLAGCPAVATLRGEDVTRAKASRVFRFFLEMAVVLNARVFCVSEAMTSEMRRLYPTRAWKIEFVPNGVVLGSGKRSKAFHSPVRLITVGSCIERKRQDLIIKAMAEPRLRGRVTLKLIGDGPMRPALSELARTLGVEDQVSFVGAVLPHRVEEELMAADVFVFSSESEGRPNAVLEAMASGLPIVASDISGVRELLGDGCGRLYEPGNSGALARVLGDLMEDEHKAYRLGKFARQKLRKLGLSWEGSAQCYLANYESSLKDKSF